MTCWKFPVALRVGLVVFLTGCGSQVKTGIGGDLEYEGQIMSPVRVMVYPSSVRSNDSVLAERMARRFAASWGARTGEQVPVSIIPVETDHLGRFNAPAGGFGEDLWPGTAGHHHPVMPRYGVAVSVKEYGEHWRGMKKEKTIRLSAVLFSLRTGRSLADSQGEISAQGFGRSFDDMERELVAGLATRVKDMIPASAGGLPPARVLPQPQEVRGL